MGKCRNQIVLVLVLDLKRGVATFQRVFTESLDLVTMYSGRAGVASILRTGLREIFVPKGLQDSAWGFYEAELVKAALQKRIFLKFCAFGLRSGDKTPTTGSLVLD
jgi:hypothetical protein